MFSYQWNEIDEIVDVPSADSSEDKLSPSITEKWDWFILNVCTYYLLKDILELLTWVVPPNYFVLNMSLLLLCVCWGGGWNIHVYLCCSRPCWRQQRPHCSLTVVSPPSSTFELDVADGGNSTRAQRGLTSPPFLRHALSICPRLGGTSY